MSTHTHTQLLTGYTISSASWSENIRVINCTCKVRRGLLKTFVGAQLSLHFFPFLSSPLFRPSSSLLRPLLSFISIFSRPRLRSPKELLSSHSGFGWSPAAKRLLVHIRMKNCFWREQVYCSLQNNCISAWNPSVMM